MKKTIEALIGKLQENVDGTLVGGFASIKGGKALNVSTNTAAPNCDNSGTCTSTNGGQGGCANSGNCSGSTNYMPCTNTGNC